MDEREEKIEGCFETLLFCCVVGFILWRLFIPSKEERNAKAESLENGRTPFCIFGVTMGEPLNEMEFNGNINWVIGINRPYYVTGTPRCDSISISEAKIETTPNSQIVYRITLTKEIPGDDYIKKLVDQTKMWLEKDYSIKFYSVEPFLEWGDIYWYKTETKDVNITLYTCFSENITIIIEHKNKELFINSDGPN